MAELKISMDMSFENHFNKKTQFLTGLVFIQLFKNRLWNIIVSNFIDTYDRIFYNLMSQKHIPIYKHLHSLEI